MKQQNKKPFFARLLETQELEKVTGGQTQKYPSDLDELEGDWAGTDPLKDSIQQTQKYPSDSDEGV